MELMPCNHSELLLRYRTTGELEVFISDLGKKGKYIEFKAADAKVKCLPLSGSMKCDHIKGKKIITEIMEKIGKKTNFGHIAKAMVAGHLELGNSGRFIFNAISINFLKEAECPIGKNCRYMEPLSAATPVLDETPNPIPRIENNSEKKIAA